MNFSEYPDTYSWKAAIELSPALLSLADELPAAETMGLGLHLRQLAIELPAGIATSLLAGKPVDLSVVLKLITTLELIDRVYPALDASPVRRRADDLAARLASDAFADRPKADVLETLAAPEPDTDTDTSAAPEPAAPVEPSEAAEAEPAAVSTPAPAPDTETETDTDTEPPAPRVVMPEHPAFAVTVRPQSSEESHVQPDSEQ